MKKEIIVKNDEPKRIDAYISEITDYSRTAVQRLIEEDKIKVNGKKEKASYKVQNGDKIEIEEEPAKEIELKAQDIPLEILYEDKDIIVVNKPKGMVVHPANGNPDGTLVNAIMSICKDSLSGIGGEIRPGIVHRLDKNTSGAIIIAKNDKAHLFLEEELKMRKINRTYIALVSGVIKHDSGEIDAPIGRDKFDRKKMAVTSNNSKPAITHFKVLERYKNATLVECKLETGRTHQIRVFLLHNLLVKKD